MLEQGARLSLSVFSSVFTMLERGFESRSGFVVVVVVVVVLARHHGFIQVLLFPFRLYQLMDSVNRAP